METTTSSDQKDGNNRLLEINEHSIAFLEKEAIANFELAKLQVMHDTEMGRNIPSENRKTIALLGGAALLALGVFLGFLMWCLSIGKEQFVIDFLQYLFYPLSAGGGFWAGRLSRSPIKEKDAS